MDDQQPAAGQSFSAFISHASRDRLVAEAICMQLESSGFRCWMAPRDIRPGEDYPEAIIRGIENSRCLILVLSKEANASSFVFKEVERASSKGKLIFPFRIEDVLPSRSLELFVSTAHWIEAWRGDMHGSVSSLAVRLGDDADLVGSLPPKLARQILWRRRRRLAGIVAMAAGMSLAVALLVRFNNDGDGGNKPYEKPAQVSFFPSSYKPGTPLRTSVLVQDGYDQDGFRDSFKSPMNLTVYDVSNGTPKLLYTSRDGQFAGFHEHAPTFDIFLPGLPLRIATCLAYSSLKSKHSEVAIKIEQISPPSRDVGTPQVSPLSEADVTYGATVSDCPRLVQQHAAKVLKDAPPLKTDMAEQASIMGWSGNCRPWGELSVLLFCNIAGRPATARNVAFGFEAHSLDFRPRLVPLSSNEQVLSSEERTEALIPRQGSSVFARLEFADGTSSKVQPLQTNADWLKRPIQQVQGTGVPPLYIDTNLNFNIYWSFAVIGPNDASAASWSRDGLSWTAMTGIGNVFAAKFEPRMLERSEPTLPSSSLFPISVKIQRMGGEPEVRSYKLDVWDVARTSMRASNPVDNAIKCRRGFTMTAAAGEIHPVLCSFQDGFKAAPGLLFQHVRWGSSAANLHDADSDMRDLGVGAQYSSVWQNILSWTKCRQTLGGNCFEPSLIWNGKADTLFFEFEYWNGDKSPVFAIPVN